jgi:hypothetical protein
MQSDPWWSLAMAVNVFLVFFFAANPNSFRSYLWLYSLVCFGLPGVPAVICLFYIPTGRKIYGNATVSLAVPLPAWSNHRRDRDLTSSAFSCGVGLATSLTNSVSSSTTCPSGCVSCYPTSSTFVLVTVSFTNATSCAT